MAPCLGTSFERDDWEEDPEEEDEACEEEIWARADASRSEGEMA